MAVADDAPRNAFCAATSAAREDDDDKEGDELASKGRTLRLLLSPPLLRSPAAIAVLRSKRSSIQAAAPLESFEPSLPSTSPSDEEDEDEDEDDLDDLDDLDGGGGGGLKGMLKPSAARCTELSSGDDWLLCSRLADIGSAAFLS